MQLIEEIRPLPVGWRYCLAIDKRPYERRWQQLDLDVAAIERKMYHGRCKATQVGLVLGEPSGGIVAIDHDGESASEVLRETFGLEQLPETATITSGKPGRFCCFYKVPESLWPGLQKEVWKAPVDGELLEVRWGTADKGHQQIVAGIHPDTGKPYRWRRHPSEGIAELPVEILTVWRDRIKGPEPEQKKQASQLKLVTDSFEFLPPEVLLSREHRTVVTDGVHEGGRNEAGFRLACDLLGIDDWARSKGHRLRERVRGMFEQFAAHCSPPLREREIETIWKSAEASNPTPCLSEDKLETNVTHWKRRQHRIEQSPLDHVPAAERVASDEHQFRFLGFNKDTYYYLPRGQRQVISITASNHIERRLLTLAPRAWWLNTFPKPGKGDPSVDWSQAVSWLYEMQHLQGVYDPRRVRGRGCWIDEERVVFHLGERVLVDTEEVEVGRVKSRYLYEQGAGLAGPDFDNPLGLSEARDILATAKLCRWEHPASAAMLVGWVVLAPICGALRWRPHCWVVGGAGSGKSTLLSDFTKPLLGELETSVLGSSTEAGLRQNLGSDAIPVLMDEAEQAQARDEERIQAVMELARASSSETGSKTLKGTASGTGQEYLIRSMFMLSSITSSLKQGSDKSRFALLTLQNPANDTSDDQIRFANQWEQLKSKLTSITPELGRRLIARTVLRLPQLLREVELFSDCCAEVFGSRRAGDQFGFLMAGAWSVMEDEEATLETAMQFIGAYDWEEFLEPAKAAADHERCLSRILETRVKTGALGEPEVPLGELVEICANRSVHRDIDDRTADKLLQRMGVKVERDDGRGLELVISTNHTAIGKVLERTPWSNDWRSVLKQIPGAEVTPSKYFRGGHQSRAVSLPAASVFKCA